MSSNAVQRSIRAFLPTRCPSMSTTSTRNSLQSDIGETHRLPIHVVHRLLHLFHPIRYDAEMRRGTLPRASQIDHASVRRLYLRAQPCVNKSWIAKPELRLAVGSVTYLTAEDIATSGYLVRQAAPQRFRERQLSAVRLTCLPPRLHRQTGHVQVEIVIHAKPHYPIKPEI